MSLSQNCNFDAVCCEILSSKMPCMCVVSIYQPTSVVNNIQFIPSIKV